MRVALIRSSQKAQGVCRKSDVSPAMCFTLKNEWAAGERMVGSADFNVILHCLFILNVRICNIQMTYRELVYLPY